MSYLRSPLSEVCPPSLRSAALFSLIALAPAALFAMPTAGNGQEPYTVSRAAAALPDGLSDAVIAHVGDEAVTVTDANDAPLMDVWFARELPEPTAPDPHPGVGYGTLNEGVVLGVMRLHREHHDYRDQPVGAGVYVIRYLRQPDDGNHLGETTYRDFAVLTAQGTATVGPQSYEDTLDDALELNLHPFAWGLWPANQIAAEGDPGIVAFQPDKWAVKLSIPRADGSSLALALVVVGNEWHY